MGAVFRKSTTRPVPKGGIVTGSGSKLTARWKGRGKKERWVTAKIFTLADGRQVIRQASEAWYIRYRSHDGSLVTESTGCREKTNAELILKDRQRTVEQIKAGILPASQAANLHSKRTVFDHLGDFLSTMTGSAMHRKNTETCCRRLIADCGWTTLVGMERFHLERWLADQARAGRSVRSSNSFQAAICTFANWCVTNHRLMANPFGGIKKPDVRTDPRRPRRALTPEELGALIQAAQDAPEWPELKHGRSTRLPAIRFTGRDRADLYLFLSSTGARVGEAKQLNVADLYLDSRIPVVKLRAATTKNSKPAEIPLREDVVAMLRERLRSRVPTEKVFDIPADLIRRFHGDLKRASVPRYDERGYQADLHCLRKSYGTALALAGVPLTVTQRLMRHSDPKLTSNLYTDIRLVDMQAAVASVAPPLAPRLDSERATESSDGNIETISIAG